MIPGNQTSQQTLAFDTSAIAESLGAVRERVAAATRDVGRDPAEVTLVAVSKTMPIEAIRAAWEAGQRVFGENRVQEAVEKMQIWRERWPNDPISWHLIGHVQTNKTRDVVGRFDLVHSVDSPRLAASLDQRAAAAGVVVPALLEVHLSAEESKFGFAPDELASAVFELRALSGLRIEGLMTIAPLDAPDESARPYFRRLRELRDELRGAFPDLSWHHLSMGMTNDYPAALVEGATLVRIGRAIFGERRRF